MGARNPRPLDLRAAGVQIAAALASIEALAVTPEARIAAIRGAAGLAAVLSARAAADCAPLVPTAGETARYLPPRAAAAFLGLSRSTVARLVTSGALTPSYVGTAARFSIADLETFMHSTKS